MKRIISFLLAVAMLVAFIPTAFAAEDSGIRVVYDVRKVMEVLQMPSLGAAVQMTAIDYEETSGFFSWISGGTGHYAGPTSAVFTYQQIANGTQCIGIANEAKVAFEINVPKAGLYDFEMYNCVSSNENLKGKAINVYLSRDGISTAEADKIGSYTCYDETVTTLTRITTPNVFNDIDFPEEGKYIVTFTTTSPRWHYNNVGTFVLNGGSGLAPMIDEISVDKEEIMVGETAKVSASAALLSDYATIAEGVTYSYSSSNEKVAKVSSNGTVTGIGMGEAEIYVTAEKNGASSLTSVAIRVNSKDASGVTAVFDMIKGARDAAFPWNAEESYLRNIDYASTKGFWRYHSTGSESHLDYHKINNAYGIYLTGTSEYTAIGINVPKSGEYIVKFTHGMASGGSTQGAMWILPGDTEDVGAAIASTPAVLNDINYYQSGSGLGLNTVDAGVHYFEKGENIVAYKVIAAGSTAMYPGKIELIGGDGDAYSGVVSVDKAELKIGETAKASANVHMSDDWSAISGYTFKSSNTSVAEVASDGTITAKKAGKAYITAECASIAEGNIIGAYITVEADKPATVSDKVSFIATSNIDADISVEGINYNGGIASVLRGEKITIEAPEVDGYTFVGWKRGSNENGRFINQPQSFEMTLLTNTYLTAVYSEKPEADEKTVEYYNENGDYISTGAAADNAPTAPTLAGYVFSGKWFVSEDVELDTSKLSDGITRAVAKHNAKDVAGNITLDGESLGAKTFNDEITLTATKSGFTSWKRDGKIVSYGRSYTYYAWAETAIEESTEAISEGKKLPIVVLDAKTVDGSVMIEYDAGDYEIVEAGIVFGANATVESCNKKFTSQRNASHGQFAAKADGAARGYIIYRDGEDYRVIYSD